MDTTIENKTEQKNYTPAEIKAGYHKRMMKARNELIKNPTDKNLNASYTSAKNNYFTIIEGYEKLT
jgi:hypothetical protein